MTLDVSRLPSLRDGQRCPVSSRCFRSLYLEAIPKAVGYEIRCCAQVNGAVPSSWTTKSRHEAVLAHGLKLIGLVSALSGVLALVQSQRASQFQSNNGPYQAAG